MRKNLSGQLFVLFLTLFSFSFTSCSNSSKGKLHSIVLQKGNVVVVSKEDKKTYSGEGKEIRVYDKEQIKTGDNTRILLNDKSTGDVIELYSDSQLRIMKLEPKSALVKLDKGKARFLICKDVAKKRKIKINTANALIGVKGTEFVVDSIPTGTSLLTLSGVVSLSNVTSPDDRVSVSANQVSQVQVARLPTQPVSVSKRAIQSILASDRPGSFNKVKFGPVIQGDPNSFSYLNIRSKSKSNQLFWAKLETSTKFDIHWTTDSKLPVSKWKIIRNTSSGYVHKGLRADKTYFYTVSYKNEANRRTYYVVKSGKPLP